MSHLSTLVFLLVAPYVASAQVGNVPVKSTDFKQGEHRFGGAIGLANTAIDLDFGGGFSAAADNDALTFDLGWTWAVQDTVQVGIELAWENRSFDDPLFKDDTTLVIDAITAFTFTRDASWGLLGFLGLGVTHNGGFHLQIGVNADFVLGPRWKLAPYLKVDTGDFSDDDTTFQLTSVQLGVNALWAVGAEWTVHFGFYLGGQTWEFQNLAGGATAKDEGDVYGFTVGATYLLR